MTRTPTLKGPPTTRRRPWPGQSRQTWRRSRPTTRRRSTASRLDAGYRAMARDAAREREARQWAEATVGDAALSDKVDALLPLLAVADDETEDRLLAESGVLAALLRQAKQTPPAPDWKQALADLTAAPPRKSRVVRRRFRAVSRRMFRR